MYCYRVDSVVKRKGYVKKDVKFISANRNPALQLPSRAPERSGEK